MPNAPIPRVRFTDSAGRLTPEGVGYLQQVNQAQSDVAGIETALATVQSQVTTLQTSLTSATSTISALSSTLTTLQSSLQALSALVTTAQSEIDALQAGDNGGLLADVPIPRRETDPAEFLVPVPVTVQQQDITGAWIV